MPDVVPVKDVEIHRFEIIEFPQRVCYHDTDFILG